MNAPDKPDDWLALGEDWRAQPAGTIDVDALRDEVRRRGRRLRWALVSELFGFALAMAVGVWVLRSEPAAMAPAVIIGLLLVLAGFQAWSLWIRRRQVRDSGVDARAMVDLEIARARTSLRYWRVSIWLSVAIWLALYALAMLGAWVADGSADVVLADKLAGSLVGAGSIGIVFAVWAWWFGRRTRARLLRLLGLRDELRDR